MKNSICGFLLCVAGMLCSTNIYADETAPADFTGHTWYEYREAIADAAGTMVDPILISTPGQLAQLAYNVNTGVETYKNKVVALAADIDLNKEVDGQRVQWIPIGYDDTRGFEGLFLGLNIKDYAANGFIAEQKHKISGMYINVTSATTAKRYGLFGCLGGNVSHLQMEDVSINVDLSGLSATEFYFVGTLCGNTFTKTNNTGGKDDIWYRGGFNESSSSRGQYVTFAIDDVSVNGSISVKGNENSNIAVGGICGRLDIQGILHSTADVTINTSDCDFVGGICGIDNGYYDAIQDYGGYCLYDCVSKAIITCNDTQNRPVKVGGIVGQMENGEKARACVSMGSIRCKYTDNTTAIHSVGGVCGNMQAGSGMYACGSTMMIKSYGNVGGIVGIMKSSTETNLPERSKVEGCSFSGHLDGSRKQIDEKGQTYYRDSTNPSYNFIGGICGHMEWDDETEHITRCLMLGTITNEDYIYTYRMPSATVGWAGTNIDKLAGDHLSSTLTYCYYDTSLFCGNVIPDSKSGGNSVKGLTTEELTSGDVTKVSWLNAGDTEPDHYGYRLEKGYYPIFYENNGSQATYYSNYSHRGYSNNNLTKLFDFYTTGAVNKHSTVYLPGAMLCATPVKFVKGDCAGDFVSTMSAPTKTYTLEEKLTGRSVTLTLESFFPESDVIRVKDKTATASNNGTCFVTTTASVRKKIVVFNRPAIISGTKYIGLYSTIDSEWRGDEATEFAAGTGTAGDPYLIKNAAQLYHAIKVNTEGKFYKQICNIIIGKGEDVNHNLRNTLIIENCFASSVPPIRHFTDGYWQADQCEWKANYNGDGHTISGLYLVDYYETPPTSETPTFFSLFGNVGENGSINNLAVVDTWIEVEPSVKYGTNNNDELTTYYGVIAGMMKGRITNCIAQGVNAVGRPCGGISACVSGGLVEDCISAVVSITSVQDQFTPLIPYASNYASSQNSIQNCLVVSPVVFSSADKSMSNSESLKDCYWLKGYEPGNTGQTLDEIGAALGKRDRWTWSRNYFPTLKTFAETDIAKLMMVPVRTDKNYEFDTSTNSANNYLLGFKKMLEFEPGAATWTNIHGTSYIEADSELGIVAPVTTMGAITPYNQMIKPMEAICASLGKSFYYIPMRTNSGNVERGITFVDSNAKAACVNAFDTDNDNRISLAEISTVTNEQIISAFNNSDVRLKAQEIVKFPEFRFFKAVTNLTSPLSGLAKLEEVRLPYNLQTISGDPSLTGSGTRPFSMTKVKTITLPAKVTTIEPGAFSGSEIDSIFVDPFNTKLESREGILFNSNNALVAFPNGRMGEEIIIPGVIEEIKPGAVYDMSNTLQKVFFDTTDYSTVADLSENGIFMSNGCLVDVYISDATYGSILFNEYLEDNSWEEYANADKLHCYYPLKIGSAKAGTMYIGFDTELPVGLKAYIVTSDSKDENLAYMRKMSNKIPNRSPVVIFANEAGTYRLFPLEESLEQWQMYQNQLNGVGRDGMEVYQSDADRGSILTLGRNSGGTLGFFYYKGTAPLAPYRAYLTYEWVNNAKQYLLLSFLNDETTGIGSTPFINEKQQETSDNAWYSLDGRRLGGLPKQRGIYIHNGKKTVIK